MLMFNRQLFNQQLFHLQSSVNFIFVLLVAMLLSSCDLINKNNIDSWHLAHAVDLESDFSLSAQGSKIIFINYWAPWCKPCIKEMPELAEFRRQQAQYVEVLAVNYDSPPIDELLKQAQQLNIDIPLLATDPAPSMEWPRQGVLPYTLMVNAKGQLLHTLIGPQDSDTLLAALQKVRAAQPQLSKE